MTTKTPEQMEMANKLETVTWDEIKDFYKQNFNEALSENFRESFCYAWSISRKIPEIDLLATGFLAGYQAAQQWIPVSERLPEYDQLVLIWHPGFKRSFVGSRVDSALMSPLYWWRCELDMYEPEEVITHWMPLPAPPEPTE